MVDADSDVRVVEEWILLALEHVAVAVALNDEVAILVLDDLHRKAQRQAALLLAAVVADDSNVATEVVHRQRRAVAGILHSIFQLLVVVAAVVAEIPSLVVAIQPPHVVTGEGVVVGLSLKYPDGMLLLAAAEFAEKLPRLLAIAVVAAAVHAVVDDRRAAVGPPVAVAVLALVVAVDVIDLEKAVNFSVLLALRNDP